MSAAASREKSLSLRAFYDVNRALLTPMRACLRSLAKTIAKVVIVRGIVFAIGVFLALSILIFSREAIHNRTGDPS